VFDAEDILLGENIQMVTKDGPCTVYKLQTGNGDGLMTCYELYPGIHLLYSDYHAQSYDSLTRAQTDMLCVEHCREGRLEWQLDDNRRLFLDRDRILVHTHEHYRQSFFSPLRHYHGLTLTIFVDKAQRILNSTVEGYHLNIHDLRQQLCPEHLPRKLAKNDIPAHFISAFYTPPTRERIALLRLKTLELLLHLNSLPAASSSDEYYCKTHVDKVKAIEQLLTAEPEARLTLAALAKRFEISPNKHEKLL
jgi:hypothetical protein